MPTDTPTTKAVDPRLLAIGETIGSKVNKSKKETVTKKSNKNLILSPS